MHLPNFSHIQLDQVQSQIKLLIREALEEIESLLDASGEKSWATFMQPMDDQGDKMHRFWSRISHLHLVKDSPELRAVYDACLPELTAYSTKLGHHVDLYEAIVALQQSKDSANWLQAQKKVIENELRDFKLAGVNLPAEKKAQMEVLAQSLAQACTLFSNNVLDATQSWSAHVVYQTRLLGIPGHVCDAAAQKAKEENKEGWLFSLDFPVYHAVQSYAQDQSLREQMYRAYVTRASDAGPQAGQHDNGPVIEEILKKRQSKAKLLGFKTYADYALETKMAATPKQVIDFLETLANASLPKAKEEFIALKAYAAQTLGLEDLQPWDMAFASESLRQKKYDVSQEQLRLYFQLPKVLESLNWLLGELFGLAIETVAGVDTWHEDAHCYRLVDAAGHVRSYYYLDLYARAGKRGGAWMDDLQGRRLCSDGSIQLPIALINCNFTPPSGQGPALLTHDEVETLFHEFGHALQHMLTTVNYSQVAGINGIPWDAVEFPSQFFENWVWEPAVLKRMTAHVETGEPISDELQQKMLQARHFQAAMKMLRQVEFALFDMRLHSEYTGTEAGQVARILKEVRDQVTVTAVVEPNRFQNGFSHIFDGGYAAGYYSYKWAEVMAVDAFMLFKDKGHFDKEIATKFLNCVLEPGGSEDPAILFQRLAGRNPDPQALLRHDQILIGD
jgi:oligopeptidase A